MASGSVRVVKLLKLVSSCDVDASVDGVLEMDGIMLGVGRVIEER